MKKITILFLIISVLLLSLAACSSTNRTVITNDDNEEEQVVVETQVEEETETTNEEGKSEETEAIEEETPEEELDVTMEETVLMDQDDILIKAMSLDADGMFGPVIDIFIENNSEEDIRVSFEAISINGFMINDYFISEVAAGKKANEELDISDDKLEQSGIEYIADISMTIEIREPDIYDDILDPIPAAIETSISSNYEQPLPVGGEVVLDQDGVKITYLSFDMDGFLGPEMYYFIENNTDNGITVQARDVSINGYMIDPTFSCDIAAGKKAVDDMSFYSSDFEDNDIDAIDYVELYFHIYDMDSWDTIFDSETIAIGEESTGTDTSEQQNGESEILLDQDGIKITYTGFDDDTSMGVGYKLLIENNSDKTITVQTRDENINGYMVDGILSADVAPDKKANEIISIWDSDLEQSDIDEIKSFEFVLKVMEEDSWDEIFVSDVITLTNTDVISDDVDEAPEGQLLVDENDIKIIFVDMEYSEYSGEKLRFYIENNSDEGISISAEDVSLNGFMLDSYMYGDILAHRKAYTILTLDDDDLEDNGIEELDVLEFIIEVSEYDGWSDIFTTDTLVIEDLS